MDVEIYEISAACGFGDVGLPIDLWNNKVLDAQWRKNAEGAPPPPSGVESASQITHARYAAPVCAQLYEFLTGNKCVVADCEWPSLLRLERASPNVCMRCVPRDAHESTLADGFVVFYTPVQWSKPASAKHTLHNLRAQEIILAHLLLQTSVQPSTSFVDVLSVVFEPANYTDPLQVATPYEHNVSLVRFYLRDGAVHLAHKFLHRLQTFVALESAARAPPWMTTRVDQAQLMSSLLSHSVFKMPHEFLCGGAFGTFACWRRCLFSSLTYEKAARNSAAQIEKNMRLAQNTHVGYGDSNRGVTRLTHASSSTTKRRRLLAENEGKGKPYMHFLRTRRKDDKE